MTLIALREGRDGGPSGIHESAKRGSRELRLRPATAEAPGSADRSPAPGGDGRGGDRAGDWGIFRESGGEVRFSS